MLAAPMNLRPAPWKAEPFHAFPRRLALDSETRFSYPFYAYYEASESHMYSRSPNRFQTIFHAFLIGFE